MAAFWPGNDEGDHMQDPITIVSAQALVFRVPLAKPV
jgi:hypothetical protein